MVETSGKIGVTELVTQCLVRVKRFWTCALEFWHAWKSGDMYSEAAAVLEPAVKADEFNGELRQLYGLALQGLKRHDEAIHNFQIASKLTGNWEILDGLLKSYLAKFAISSANEDRISAFTTASQLLMTSTNHSEKLTDAESRAAKVIIDFLSAVGVWREDLASGGLGNRDKMEVKITEGEDGSFYLMENVPEKWPFVPFHLHFKKTQAENGVTENRLEARFAGSAPNSDGGCIFDFDYSVRLTQAGTKLLVMAQPTNYRGLDPLFSAKFSEKIASKMCADLIRKEAAGNLKNSTFERVP